MRDFNVVEGIDRTRYQAYAAERGQLTGMELGTGSCGPGGVPHASCHPYWYFYQYQQSHDASGNVDATWQLDTRGTDAASAEPVTDETRSYYAADEKLVYQGRRVGNGYYAQEGSGFEEYRYDALGRRILTRSRRAAGCAYPCEAYVQRTVWDGDQVLYELRTSGGQGVDSSYFEMDAGVAAGDDPNLYGIVAYAHAEAALGIDQPVGILKKVPSTGWAYVTPHTNWKGDWSYGTFSDGTLCLTTGATCPTWPGFMLTMDRASQGVTPPSYTVWWGNLIRGAADGSGLVYQRNRYYDPKTGRFTQVDPIGLAGGLNNYGFASGDPVTFSDPFGLCKPWPTCLLAALGTAVVADAAPAAPAIPSATILSPYIVAAGIGDLTLSPAFPEVGVPATQPGASGCWSRYDGGFSEGFTWRRTSRECRNGTRSVGKHNGDGSASAAAGSWSLQILPSRETARGFNKQCGGRGKDSGGQN